MERGDNVTGDRFAAADRIHAFVGLGLEVNFLCWYAQRFGQDFPHSWKMRSQLRALENHYSVDVLDRKMLFVEKLARVFEENQAVGALPLWIVVWKMRANVTQPGSAKQRIAKRMGEHVAIGMPDGSFVKRDFDSTDDEFSALSEPMKVIANSASDAHAFFCSEWR